jgi:hypothetical protein
MAAATGLSSPIERSSWPSGSTICRMSGQCDAGAVRSRSPLRARERKVGHAGSRLA